MSVRPGRDIKAPFVTGGNPDTANDAPVTVTTVGAAYDLSGQLGAVYRSPDGSGKEWIYVKFSSTSTGKTPAANQLCFWIVNSTANLASPGAWVVDNQTSANSGASAFDCAGLLRNACTRGNYVWLMRKSGSVAVPVVSTSTVGVTAAGVTAVIATTASGEAACVSSTSTVVATSINASPWWLGAPRIGYIASSSTAPAFVGSTATGGVGANIPTFLDIE